MRIFLMLLAMLVSQAALAQAWPNRPVRLLVPFAAGAGINDIMARLQGEVGKVLRLPEVRERLAAPRRRAGAGSSARRGFAPSSWPACYSARRRIQAVDVRPSTAKSGPSACRFPPLIIVPASEARNASHKG
jgi:hypothetical protein